MKTEFDVNEAVAKTRAYEARKLEEARVAREAKMAAGMTLADLIHEAVDTGVTMDDVYEASEAGRYEYHTLLLLVRDEAGIHAEASPLIRFEMMEAGIRKPSDLVNPNKMGKLRTEINRGWRVYKHSFYDYGDDAIVIYASRKSPAQLAKIHAAKMAKRSKDGLKIKLDGHGKDLGDMTFEDIADLDDGQRTDLNERFDEAMEKAKERGIRVEITKTGFSVKF